ncbi:MULTISPECIES: transposase [Pantoea]|uniref:transposase n=1 Tax=Pantoea TaxID=53335 RepID=UPI0012E09158|nr:transposase [Pantoea rodasii]
MTAIEAHISVSGAATSHTTNSHVLTDSVMPELNKWQQHSRERVYSSVRLDAIHSKIRKDGRYQSKVTL